ncbi:hypothetical protein JRO89_XS07G0249700 [Xanthoceras sorbifolium]|uniref:Protein kinase domain-containing protein n=1 Tax=Xanthoceras sorbifolium TaxID=99658 RepID=A0ABQ8HUW1_9ROSI|nr:hypothetical protein JRO89_XS07G0249700 [Xanthoceras sorbifolium]
MGNMSKYWASMGPLLPLLVSEHSWRDASPTPRTSDLIGTGISLGSLFLLIGGSVDGSKLFSSKELNKAAGHFNEHRILGQGGQGTVFKGILLSDGRIVAVKKSTIIDNGKLAEFINEVAILSQMDFFAIGLYAFWAIASFLASLFYLIMPHIQS